MAYRNTYYVRPAAAGANNGSNWADAWTNPQSAFDTATAGDLVYMRGTFSTSTSIDIDTNSGTSVSGWITFMGCADSGTSTTATVDGTRFVIDGKNNCIPIITTSMTYIRMENIEIRNGVNGWDASGAADYWIWVNCSSHDNSNSGWALSGCDYHYFYKCQAYNNGSFGFSSATINCHFFFCTAYDNTDSGFDNGSARSFFIGCVSHDNGSSGDCGYRQLRAGSIMFNCIADKEVKGLENIADFSCIHGTRFTSCSVGIDFASNDLITGWNYFHDNTSDIMGPTSWSEEGVNAIFIRDESTSNTNISGTDADDGYNDKSNHDFNIKASRTYNGESDDAIDTNYGT